MRFFISYRHDFMIFLMQNSHLTFIINCTYRTNRHDLEIVTPIRINITFIDKFFVYLLNVHFVRFHILGT